MGKEQFKYNDNPLELLKRGVRGNLVKLMQENLNKLGFNNTPDGIFGRNTEDIVKRYQSSVGIVADGYAGEDTLANIQNSLLKIGEKEEIEEPGEVDVPVEKGPEEQPVEKPLGVENEGPLKLGVKGTKTQNLQIRLNQLGLKVGFEDGVFGKGTEKSIKELQSIFGLKSDGIVGNGTWALLTTLNDVTHFSLREFGCRHCGEIKLDINLLLKLEELRKQTGPLKVNSGYRCRTHNRNVGGASRSQHLLSTAADLRAVNLKPSQVYDIANKIFNNGGVGKYKTFTHVDVRGYRSRWRG